MKRWTGMAAAAALLLLAGAAQASWPCGIYARIDKVEAEPNTDKPTWVKVWGDFILIKTSNRETPVTRGYMYFEVVKGKEDLCRLEWKDLKEIAGTENNYVAFGSVHSEINDNLSDDGDTPKVSKKDDRSPKPIPYPLNHGLTRLRTRQDLFNQSGNNPVVRLKDFLDKNKPEKP
jgi:hypothetical protein